MIKLIITSDSHSLFLYSSILLWQNSYIVNEVRQGADLRKVDLSRAHDCSPEEITIFSDHVRDVYSLCLKRCSILDSTISLVGKRCRYLRELDLTGCSELTDASCEDLGKTCKDLERLSIAGCGKITDEGVSDIARSIGGSLTALNLNRCQYVCDDSLTAIGESCQKLSELHLSWMQQITDRGVYTFASYANVEAFHTLDLSACRKIADDGVIGVAERLTNLTDLSVYYCNKITDRGALSITHNLYKLKRLVLADLYQITDTCLHFDRDGDGRPVIDANMLKSLEKLDLTDCNRLTDFGFASLVTRCLSMRKLVLAGCVGLTDKALEMIRTNPIHSPTYATESKRDTQLEDTGAIADTVLFENDSLAVASSSLTPSKKGAKLPRYPAIIPNWVRFDRLDTLNIAYCASFTDRGVESISATCKALTSVNISGCTRMTDEALRLLCTCCPCISHIEMAYCHNMTDVSLHHMAQELWVESLNIGHCTRISDEGIITLVGRCNGINKLHIPWCRKITDRSMNFLAIECKHVELLDISAISSASISDAVLARIKETNPTVKIVKDSHLRKKDAEALVIEAAPGSGGPETLEDV